MGIKGSQGVSKGQTHRLRKVSYCAVKRGNHGVVQKKQEGKEKEKGLEEAWGNLVGAIELELCGVTDSYCDGLPDGKHLGREEGPKYAQTQVLPPRVAGKYGGVDPVTHLMLWARNRVT